MNYLPAIRKLIRYSFLSLIVISRTIGAPHVSHLFSAHMVLQREMLIRVWGTANAGEPIGVTLAGAIRSTSASANGRWSVALPAMPAGGPFMLEIRGNTTLRFKDVMIGEVWVASGQSNMTYAVSGALTGP